jgi:hypothetical protein
VKWTPAQARKRVNWRRAQGFRPASFAAKMDPVKPR